MRPAILTLNAGSSTVKYALFADDGVTELSRGTLEETGEAQRGSGGSETSDALLACAYRCNTCCCGILTRIGPGRGAGGGSAAGCSGICGVAAGASGRQATTSI